MKLEVGKNIISKSKLLDSFSQTIPCKKEVVISSIKENVSFFGTIIKLKDDDGRIYRFDQVTEDSIESMFEENHKKNRCNKIDEILKLTEKIKNEK